METESSQVVRDFLQHRDGLYAFVLALSRDADAAEELFQEVGVAILSEAARGVRPDDFLPWARTIARHRVADHYRKVSRRAGKEVPLEAAEGMNEVIDQAFAEHGAAVLEGRERVKFLRECLGRLGKQARAMIDLRYRDRRPIAEVAAQLGWKPPSVKVALSRTRRALADCVGRKLGMRLVVSAEK